VAVLLQSFVSVVDELQPLSIEPFMPALKVEHSIQNESFQEHYLNDCHHCNQCSGNHGYWMLFKVCTPNLSL